MVGMVLISFFIFAQITSKAMVKLATRQTIVLFLILQGKHPYDGTGGPGVESDSFVCNFVPFLFLQTKLSL